MNTYKSWIRAVEHENDMVGVYQQTYGYEQFLKLWQQRERPEGLLIHPDAVVSGALLAIREQGVRVPEDLKLVLHKNENVGLLCPMPATLIVTSEQLFAEALAEQLEKQHRGEPCEPIMTPYRLEKHRGDVASSPPLVGASNAC